MGAEFHQSPQNSFSSAGWPPPYEGSLHSLFELKYQLTLPLPAVSYVFRGTGAEKTYFF